MAAEQMLRMLYYSAAENIQCGKRMSRPKVWQVYIMNMSMTCDIYAYLPTRPTTLRWFLPLLKHCYHHCYHHHLLGCLPSHFIAIILTNLAIEGLHQLASRLPMQQQKWLLCLIHAICAYGMCVRL